MQSVSIEFTPEVSGVSLALTWYGAGVGVWVGIIEWSDIALYRYVEPGHVQGESDNPFRFAGEHWDSHTQTYYLRARHFNPRTGRFLTPDPHWDITTNAIFGDSPTLRNDRYVPSIHAILQSGNLFAFGMNNPVMFIDPSGRVAVPWQAVNPLANFLPWLLGGITTVKMTSKTAAATFWVPIAGKVAIAAAIVATGVVLYRAASVMPDVRATYNWMTIQLAKTLTHTQGQHSVYIIRDKNTNLIHYVGRTVDFGRRRYAHQSQPGARFPTSAFEMRLVLSKMNERDARALEQSLITANVILALGNKINAIAARNLSGFADEFQRIQDLVSQAPPTP